MSTSINLSQPSIALVQSVVSQGPYPQYPQYNSWWNPTSDGSTLGIIHTTAYQPSGSYLTPLNGGIIPYEANKQLFSLVGYTFGGIQGQSFGLPDLTGKVIVAPGSAPGSYYAPNAAFGAVQGTPGNLANLLQQQLPSSLGGMSVPINTTQYGQNLNYVIQIEGLFPQGPDTISTIGNIYPFLGTQAPTGFVLCDGRQLLVSQYAALYSLIGNQYGADFGSGNWETMTFNVPNLNGTVPIGTGGQYNIGERSGYSTTQIFPWGLGNGNFGTLQTKQSSLGLNYIISTTGTTQPESLAPMLGEITLYAGMRPADGWVVCNGQLLSISQYGALYQLIGTTFGGDGVTTFAVPDLRDRTVIGSGIGLPIGTVSGQSTVTLTSANYPTITVPVPGVILASDTGASGNDLVTSNANLTVSSIWPDATTQYSSDGKTWTSSFKPVEGTNTVFVRQLDVLGQASQASHALVFTLDTKAPVSPTVNIEYGFGNLIVGAGGSGVTTLSGNLVLSGIEAGAKLSYSIDGGKTWLDHFQAVLGNNSVQIRQTDLAGNISPASAPIVFQMLSDPTQKATLQVTTLPSGGHEIITKSPGSVGDDVATAFTDTIRHNLQSSLTLPNHVENIILTGLGGGNIITGNSDANRFEVQSGSWVINGADGKDSVVFTENASQYRLTQSRDLKITVDGLSIPVSVTISGSPAPNDAGGLGPKLVFKDVTLTATDAASAKGLFGLYAGVLNRTPDLNGQAAWQHALDQGVSLSRIADAIVGSTEYTDRYGSASSTKDFVLHLYENALHRTADSRGLSAWINAIDSHTLTKGEVAVAITGSAEAKPNLPVAILQIA